MSSKRDKKTGITDAFCRKSKEQIDKEYKTEQQQATIRLESDSEDEREVFISTTTSEALLSTLKKTCSDSQDSSNELPRISGIPRAFELQDGGSMNESAMLMNLYSSISRQIAGIHNNTERVEKDVSIISEHLERVEKKVGISLATLEKVKVAVVKYDVTSEKAGFVFKKITNEKEFTEFDTKLGTDKEYYSVIKKDLNMHIQAIEPDKRMQQAIDMIFDRKFMTQCCWTGFGRQDIGSNRFINVNEIYIQKFFIRKLRHAKDRLNIKGIKKTNGHKRRSFMTTASQATAAAKQAK